MQIRAKAGMKTQPYRNCIRKLQNPRMPCKDINKQKTRKDDERRVFREDRQPMRLSIAAERAVHQIMSNSILSKKEKKEDVKFF